MPARIGNKTVPQDIHYSKGVSSTANLSVNEEAQAEDHSKTPIIRSVSLTIALLEGLLQAIMNITAISMWMR
eukprot:scaffold1640_cov161-Amphora_coffeaeformis.AAC.1